MKHIKNYLKFNESIDQENLDGLLDKISKFGIESLSKEESDKLIDHSNGVYDPKDDIIEDINDVIMGKFNGYTNVSLIGLDQSPVLKYDDGENHLIEEFEEDYCTIVVYTDDEEYINTYNEEYKDIDVDVLKSILKILIED